MAKNTASEKVAYSPGQAAAAVGVGRTFIFERIRDGSLRAKKAGRRTLIDADDLLAWVKALPRIAGANDPTRQGGGREL